MTLTSGDVDGWVMLHHPDLGDLIRHLGELEGILGVSTVGTGIGFGFGLGVGCNGW